MRDVMIDLETLGTGPSAAIIAIGAIAFDLETNQLGPKFYTAVSLASSVGEGGMMDADTVQWWMRQSDAARAVFNAENKSDIEGALIDFETYLIDLPCEFNDRRIWGNGSDFDNVILRSAYDRLHIPAPWKFYNNRCYRTVKSLFPHVPFESVGVAHNALDDATAQALHLLRMIGGAK